MTNIETADTIATGSVVLSIDNASSASGAIEWAAEDADTAVMVVP